MLNLHKLRGLRVENKLTQIEMAKRSNIASSTYQRKETGESPFTLEEAYRISIILNKSIEEIFFTN